MDDTCVIDGQRYIPVKETTIEQDFYVMGQIRKAGLDCIAPRRDETEDGYALRLVAAVIDAGVPFALLGGLLVPEGAEWSPERAVTTAQTLAAAKAPGDKAKVEGLLINALAGFFAEGLRLLRVSSTASNPQGGSQPAKPPAGSSCKTSGTGDPSSGSWLDGTSTATVQ